MFVRGRVEDHIRLFRCEETIDPFGIADVRNARFIWASGRQRVQLIAEIKQRVFVALDEQEARRAKRGDLSAQFGSD